MGAKMLWLFWHTKYIRYLRGIFVGSEYCKHTIIENQTDSLCSQGHCGSGFLDCVSDAGWSHVWEIVLLSWTKFHKGAIVDI